MHKIILKDSEGYSQQIAKFKKKKRVEYNIEWAYKKKLESLIHMGEATL